jgi:hypothetical protein
MTSDTTVVPESRTVAPSSVSLELLDDNAARTSRLGTSCTNLRRLGYGVGGRSAVGKTEVAGDEGRLRSAGGISSRCGSMET